MSAESFFGQKVTVVDFHQQIALLDGLAGDDVQDVQFAADLGFDVELCGGRDVATHFDTEIDVPLFGFGQELVGNVAATGRAAEFALQRERTSAEEQGDGDDNERFFHEGENCG